MNYEILLVVMGVENKTPFEKYLKKEGFQAVKNEEFAYNGVTNLPLMNTRAFIFNVLKKAMELSNTKELSFACQLDKNELEFYKYDRKINDFTQSSCSF